MKGPYEDIQKTIAVMRFFEYNSAVYHRLLDSDAVCEVVEDLLGKNFVFSTSEGGYRFGNTWWHHDDVSPGDHIHLKVVLYLDPVSADTGCLSVLPGSHFLPYRQRMERYGGDILPLGRDVPGTYSIASNPGDVVVFNVKLYRVVSNSTINPILHIGSNHQLTACSQHRRRFFVERIIMYIGLDRLRSNRPSLSMLQIAHPKEETDKYTFEVTKNQYGCHVDLYYDSVSIMDRDLITIKEKYLVFYNSSNIKGILITFAEKLDDDEPPKQK